MKNIDTRLPTRADIDPEIALHRPPPIDTERDEQRQSLRARDRQLRADYVDMSIPANEKIACGVCHERIPAGASFAVHFSALMMLAHIHCVACYAEDTGEKSRLFIMVKEEKEDS